MIDGMNEQMLDWQTEQIDWQSIEIPDLVIHLYEYARVCISTRYNPRKRIDNTKSYSKVSETARERERESRSEYVI